MLQVRVVPENHKEFRLDFHKYLLRSGTRGKGTGSGTGKPWPKAAPVAAPWSWIPSSSNLTTATAGGQILGKAGKAA